MRLVKPSTEILSISGKPDSGLELIELAGRTCYKSEDRIGPGTAEKFVQMVLKRGHESVIEHSMATVRFIVDRGVSHELVRHRLCAFSQESTRYCNYSGGVTFVIPPWVEFPPGEYHSNTLSLSVVAAVSLAENIWYEAMETAESHYLKLLYEGWSPQQARSVLPNSLKTEIVVTANFREWRHIFKLRCSQAAHPQMREVMIPLRDEFRNRIPVLFDGIDD